MQKREVYILDCQKCIELKTTIRIDSPRSLDKCEIRAEEYIKSKIIHLVKDNSWSSDYIEKVYKCNFCGSQFILCAETYHGQGGEWKLIDK